MKTTICPYCKKEVKGGRSFGAHKTNCVKNPKYQSIRAKIKEKIQSKHELVYRCCETCSKEFPINNYKNEKRFCSISCANKKRIRKTDRYIKYKV